MTSIKTEIRGLDRDLLRELRHRGIDNGLNLGPMVNKAIQHWLLCEHNSDPVPQKAPVNQAALDNVISLTLSPLATKTARSVSPPSAVADNPIATLPQWIPADHPTWMSSPTLIAAVEKAVKYGPNWGKYEEKAKWENGYYGITWNTMTREMYEQIEYAHMRATTVLKISAFSPWAHARNWFEQKNAGNRPWEVYELSPAEWDWEAEGWKTNTPYSEKDL